MMGAMRVETIGCFHITMSAPKDVCWSIVMDNAEWLTGYTLMRAHKRQKIMASRERKTICPMMKT